MTAAADLVLTNAEVHTLGQSDDVYEAVAIRDGDVVRAGKAYEVTFLEDVETRVLDLGGRVVLPGFIDAHTHLERVGRYLVHADLSEAADPADAVSRLRESAHNDREWILGYGYDESTWGKSRYLTRDDLDRVSRERPVAAFREDMHTASVNSVALNRHIDEMPDGFVRWDGGEPDGVIVEEAVDVIYRAVQPDRDETRELLLMAQERANELGVTGVHEMVRRSHAPRVYRDLDREGELTLRVRLNYWVDHLDAVLETGLRSNAGSNLVQIGGIKTYTDGSIGGRTAKLRDPYAGGTDDAEHRGHWVVDPDELREIVARADDAGLQVCAHAIGDAAVEATLGAYVAEADDPATARHRVEHAEVLTGDLVERFADVRAVASVQPNFLKWAREGGLYESRLGAERARQSNRYRDLLKAGVQLAFGSDCMPLDPLFGVQQAVTAPAESQRLSVTEALRAYTRGAAYAGFDEDRLGTVECGAAADLVALEVSPWEVDPEAVGEIDVALTVIDGEIVHDGR